MTRPPKPLGPPEPPANRWLCGWCGNSWPDTEGDTCSRCVVVKAAAIVAAGVMLVYVMMFVAEGLRGLNG